MYASRWELIGSHITGTEFVLVDWGSDAGWFSIKTAHEFPKATVVSVEAGIMSYGEGIRTHNEKLNSQGITNNILVNTIFGPDTFEGLRKMPSDYQLVLSVFHHLGDGFGRYLNRAAEWDDALCNVISCANVTFFEIPNEGNPNETPHRIREWYSGKDVETVIRSALKSKRVKASVEELGETQHGAKGPRKLFKITLDEQANPASAEDIAAQIHSIGRQIRIRPYRQFRLLISRLIHLMRLRGK